LPPLLQARLYELTWR